MKLDSLKKIKILKNAFNLYILEMNKNKRNSNSNLKSKDEDNSLEKINM